MMLDAVIARAGDAGGSVLLSRGSIIPVFFALVVALAVIETSRLLSGMGYNPHTPWALIMCVTLVISPWLCAGEVIVLSVVDVEAFPWQLSWLIVAIVGTAVAQLRRSAAPGAFADINATLFIVVYLGLLPSFAVLLRCDFNIADPTEGMWIVMLVLLLTFATDIGAYFVGMSIGRHRLAPTVSPGKSVEGAIGGLLVTIGLALLLRWWGSTVVDPMLSPDDAELTRVHQLLLDGTAVLARMSVGQTAVFAVVISLLAQIGDLFESLLKRSAQVKDSSRLIPGMGGVLDLIDGVLFAIPGAWFLLTRLWQVV